MKRQIRNPYVRFARGATGPYANKLRRGMHAKTFVKREEAFDCDPGRVGAADFSDWGTIDASISGANPSGIIPAVTGEGQKYVFKDVVLDQTIFTYTVFGTFSPGPGSNWVLFFVLNRSGSTVFVYFDVANGVKGSENGTELLQSSIEPVGGGKYRCSMTFNPGTGGNTPFVRVYMADDDGDISVGGDGSTVWHFQEDIFLCVNIPAPPG